MKVNIGNKVRVMPRGAYKGLLEVAKEQVPFGIYALEKGNYAELRNDPCDSMAQLKALTRQFKQMGFKVHSNQNR